MSDAIKIYRYLWSYMRSGAISGVISTFIFTLPSTIFISILYGRRLLQDTTIFVKSSVLMIFLGLNVSILGLVYIKTNSVYLIFELFGLIVALGAIYTLVFIVLEKKRIVKGKII